MLNRIKSLVYFSLKITLNNKLVFIFTLLFPVVFLFLNRRAFSTTNGYIYGFWSYIIVAGALHTIVTGMVGMRENNLLKMFSYLAKSKQYVFYSNLIAQTVIIELELLVFNLFAIILIPPHSIDWLWQSMLISLFLFPLCGIILAIFLIFKMRINSLSALVTGYLLLMLTTAYINVNKTIDYVLVAVNPFTYFAAVFDFLLSPQNHFVDLAILACLGGFYLLIGLICIRKMPVSGSTSRY